MNGHGCIYGGHPLRQFRFSRDPKQSQPPEMSIFSRDGALARFTKILLNPGAHWGRMRGMQRESGVMLTGIVARKARARNKPCKMFDSNHLFLLVTPTGGKALALSLQDRRQGDAAQHRPLPRCPLPRRERAAPRSLAGRQAVARPGRERGQEVREGRARLARIEQIPLDRASRGGRDGQPRADGLSTSRPPGGRFGRYQSCPSSPPASGARNVGSLSAGMPVSSASVTRA